MLVMNPYSIWYKSPHSKFDHAPILIIKIISNTNPNQKPRHWGHFKSFPTVLFFASILSLSGLNRNEKFTIKVAPNTEPNSRKMCKNSLMI
jgi:hypothetical protein